MPAEWLRILPHPQVAVCAMTALPEDECGSASQEDEGTRPDRYVRVLEPSGSYAVFDEVTEAAAEIGDQVLIGLSGPDATLLCLLLNRARILSRPFLMALLAPSQTGKS
jgi:hypothetical protein